MDIKIKEAKFHDNLVQEGKMRREQKYYTYESMIDVIKVQDKFLGDLTDKKVLDYGCGVGWLTVDLLLKGAKVHSIDISPKSIEKTKERVKKLGFSNFHNATVMDCLKLDFPNNTFDVVAGNGILHHLDDLDKGLNEIKRVLKNGGYMVFYEPLGKNPIINLYRSLTKKSRTEDEKPLTKKELEMITDKFSDWTFYYFGYFDILSKIFTLLKLKKLERITSNLLKKIDRKILGEETKKITFINQLSWIIVMKAVK